jgi:hypothetical protein
VSACRCLLERERQVLIVWCPVWRICPVMS